MRPRFLRQAGRDYLVDIREALDHVGAATERLMQRQSAGVLTVSTSQDFAAKWLVHRLARFAAAHPGIDLRVSATMHNVDFAREDADVAVRHGDGNWPGLDVTRLRAEQIFAVCSPKLLAGRDRLRRPADVLKWPPVAARGSEQGMGAVVHSRRCCGAGAIAGAGSEPREYVDRCSDRRPRYRARAHHPCSVGPNRRTDRQTVRPVMAARRNILDRESERDGEG